MSHTQHVDYLYLVRKTKGSWKREPPCSKEKEAIKEDSKEAESWKENSSLVKTKKKAKKSP